LTQILSPPKLPTWSDIGTRIMENNMGEVKKRYIVDEQNRRIAVQIDIEAFEKIEEILENYALVQLMKETTKMTPWILKR
jgi:hypothetical protein